VADPAHSVFTATGTIARSRKDGACSVIEGIGRPRVEPSFVPNVIDRMEVVEDAASIAAARALSRHLGRRVGGSTGTNLIACARLASDGASRPAWLDRHAAVRFR
jgi:cysteine synthase A